MATVLTLDLAILSDDAHPQQANELLRLAEMLSEHGFVKFVNHGLAENDVERMFEWVRPLSDP